MAGLPGHPVPWREAAFRNGDPTAEHTPTAQFEYRPPPPSELLSTPAVLSRWAVAACAGLLAFVVANVYASFVYRDWRADLETWIDEPAERAEPGAMGEAIATGNSTTQWAVRLIALALVAMVITVLCWSVAALRNQRALRLPTPGFVAWTREEQEEQEARARETAAITKRTRMGPRPVLWLSLAVFAVTSYPRIIGPMSHYYDETSLRQVQMEIDYVGDRIAYALIQAGCALAMAFVVTWTTRRQLRVLRERDT